MLMGWVETGPRLRNCAEVGVTLDYKASPVSLHPQLAAFLPS